MLKGPSSQLFGVQTSSAAEDKKTTGNANTNLPFPGNQASGLSGDLSAPPVPLVFFSFLTSSVYFAGFVLLPFFFNGFCSSKGLESRLLPGDHRVMSTRALEHTRRDETSPQALSPGH